MPHSSSYLKGINELLSRNHPAGHPFIRVSDDIGYLLLYSVVSQQHPEGLPVHAVKCFFIVHKVDIKRRIPPQRLLQDETQRCDLVGARPIFTETSLRFAKLWVYGIFHPAQQDSVNHLSCNGQHYYTSIIGAGAEITFFFEKLDEVILLLAGLLYFPDRFLMVA